MLKKKWGNRTSHIFLVEVQSGTSTLENNLVFVANLMAHKSYDSAMSLLEKYPMETHRGLPGTNSRTFIEMSSIIEKTLNITQVSIERRTGK